MAIGRAAKTTVIVVTLALALPPAALAGTKVYAGTAEIGGQVAMDVKLSKAGVAKRITSLRATGLPGTCEISGGPVPLHVKHPANVKVSKQGEFSYAFTDAHGNKTSFSGKFKGRKDKRVTGKLRYANHFPAEGPYPAEDCTTERTRFEGKKGAPDIDVPVSGLSGPVRAAR